MTHMTSVAPTIQVPTKKPLGALSDPAGDLSSKRLESLMAFAMALLIAIADFVLGANGIQVKGVPVVELVVTLLSYSAAMQGVSAFSERNLFPGGTNTGSLLGSPSSSFTTSSATSVLGKLLGPTMTASGVSSEPPVPAAGGGK